MLLCLLEGTNNINNDGSHHVDVHYFLYFLDDCVFSGWNEHTMLCQLVGFLIPMPNKNNININYYCACTYCVQFLLILLVSATYARWGRVMFNFFCLHIILWYLVLTGIWQPRARHHIIYDGCYFGWMKSQDRFIL